MLAAGGDLSTTDSTPNAQTTTFFGHWKPADFVNKAGASTRPRLNKARADVRSRCPILAKHSCSAPFERRAAACSAARLRMLVKSGPNVKTTTPGADTGAFMRIVRTRG